MSFQCIKISKRKIGKLNELRIYLSKNKLKELINFISYIVVYFLPQFLLSFIKLRFLKRSRYNKDEVHDLLSYININLSIR